MYGRIYVPPCRGGVDAVRAWCVLVPPPSVQKVALPSPGRGTDGRADELSGRGGRSELSNSGPETFVAGVKRRARTPQPRYAPGPRERANERERARRNCGGRGGRTTDDRRKYARGERLSGGRWVSAERRRGGSEMAQRRAMTTKGPGDACGSGESVCCALLQRPPPPRVVLIINEYAVWPCGARHTDARVPSSQPLSSSSSCRRRCCCCCCCCRRRDTVSRNTGTDIRARGDNTIAYR